MDSTMYLDSVMGAAESTLFGAVAGFFATYSVVVIALIIISVIANWKINTKAGEPGWACLVPIYANIVQFKIVGLNPWLLFLYLLPIANVVVAAVFAIVVPFRLAKSFGKDIAWGLGLWLLPFIFYLILGLGSSEYVGPNGESKV